MCQTLLNELKVTADILLIWPGHQQLGAHLGGEKKKKAGVYMFMSTELILI